MEGPREIQKTVRGGQLAGIGKETHLIGIPLSQPVYFIEIQKSNLKNANEFISPLKKFEHRHKKNELTRIGRHLRKKRNINSESGMIKGSQRTICHY
jgi:hypothetical protein